MSNIDNINKELDIMLKQIEEKKQNAEDKITEAEILFTQARDLVVEAEEEKTAINEEEKSLEEVRQKVIEAEEAIKEANEKTEIAERALEEAKVNAVEETNVEDETLVCCYEEDKTEKKNGKGKKIAKGVICVFTAAALLAGGYVLGRYNIFGVKDNDDDKDNDKSNSVSDAKNEQNNNSLDYDYDNNEVIVSEKLTTENFENIVANYSKIYTDNGVNSISTEDIIKFSAITNIDKLAEDNPQLAKELFSTQTKEEYLNDAAKVIGATVMYNYTVYNNTNSTEGFIKVSEAVIGSQKESMLKIEEYTDKIADAVNKDDKELVNSLVSEFIQDLNSGELSKLDDGVGFAAQVNIALISDVIARNYLNQENFEMLQTLKTSEKYVSNIFTVYENCNENVDVKTLTR